MKHEIATYTIAFTGTEEGGKFLLCEGENVLAALKSGPKTPASSFYGQRGSIASLAGSDPVHALDDVEGHVAGMADWRAFRDQDMHGVVNNHAYGWIMDNVAPHYVTPALDLENGRFILRSDDPNPLATPTRPGKPGAPSAGPRRPKRRAKIKHGWF